MKWIELQRVRGIVTILVSAFIFGGCQTPDLKPFRDSTAKIHNSVLEAKDLFLEEQERVKEFVPDASKLALEREIDLFKTNWSARVNIMESMVKYASSLASVAEAPDRSKAALEGVGESVAELAVAAGPYAPAVEGAKNIALEHIDLANRERLWLWATGAVGVLCDPWPSAHGLKQSARAGSFSSFTQSVVCDLLEDFCMVVSSCT